MKKQIIDVDDEDYSLKLKEVDLVSFVEKVKMFDWIKRKKLRRDLKKKKMELCLEVVKINKQLQILDELDEKEGVGKKK